MFPRPSPVRNAVTRRTWGRWEVGERLSGASLIMRNLSPNLPKGWENVPNVPHLPHPVDGLRFLWGNVWGKVDHSGHHVPRLVRRHLRRRAATAGPDAGCRRTRSAARTVRRGRCGRASVRVPCRVWFSGNAHCRRRAAWAVRTRRQFCRDHRRRPGPIARFPTNAQRRPAKWCRRHPLPQASRRHCRGSRAPRRRQGCRPSPSTRTSKLPTIALPRGMPAATHARQSVRQAATKRPRFSLTHAIKLGCLKPLRRQGWSCLASRRMRTRRRAISLENSGLLPVATHRQRIGSRTISDMPNTRSSQKGAVRAADSAEEFELPPKVVDQDERRDLSQLGCDAFPPFLVIAAFDHHADAAAGDDHRDGVDHQCCTCTGCRLLDDMERRRAIHHRPHEAGQE